MELKCLAVQIFDAKTCCVIVPTYYMADHRMKFVPCSSSQFSSQKLNS